MLNILVEILFCFPSLYFYESYYCCPPLAPLKQLTLRVDPPPPRVQPWAHWTVSIWPGYLDGLRDLSVSSSGNEFSQLLWLKPQVSLTILCRWEFVLTPLYINCVMNCVNCIVDTLSRFILTQNDFVRAL